MDLSSPISASADAMREIIDSGARELAAAAQDIYGANDPLANDRVLLRRVLKAANGDTYAAKNTIIDGHAASVAPPRIIFRLSVLLLVRGWHSGLACSARGLSDLCSSTYAKKGHRPDQS